MSAIWQKDFSGDQHKTLVNKLGNLTLLTEPMNKEVSNGGFVKKREKYTDSKYAMTRKIARECNFWTPTEISNRADEIIDWAVSRWVEE